MSTQRNSGRVVNLSDFRAARAALKALATPPAPYLLWYPGLGYVQVDPSMTAVAASGAAITRHPPRY